MPTCDSESDEVVTLRDEDVGKIKYLVEREVVFLIELGRGNDSIFGVIGCLIADVQGDEYPAMHGPGD